MKYNYSDIVEYLLDWYDLNARILPWRSDPKGYYVWVSEIMLQQTRVEAVKGYFDRFIKELPDIKALAEASDEKVLKLWEGLGYYSRVRNLKKAALEVMEEHQGQLPNSYDLLLKLPGIGAYTAGAIASIAYHIPVPAVDGNVLRVTKRISGSFDDITKQSIKTELTEDLKEIMPADRPGDFNQSLMELGATVCIPNGKPLCDKCPVMHLCTAFKQDLTARIPVKPAKKARKIEDRTILLIELEDNYVIQKRAEKGLLAGLYELPSLDGKWSSLKLRESMKEAGLKDFELTELGEAKHIFSHIEWHMAGYRISIKKPTEEQEQIERIKMKFSADGIWAGYEEIQKKYTLPTAFEAYMKFMRSLIS